MSRTPCCRTTIPADYSCRCYWLESRHQAEHSRVSEMKQGAGWNNWMSQTMTDIGTAEAATVMGCTQRRVQQKIAGGQLNAEIISGRYVLRRKDIA